ncbi:MAG TPA: YlmC/YmxH family sporulation protein [Massilibacterium sp.]|nr:YlmC/YmxH family sporulation protein [Massilibacterium sp.]
MRLSELSGKEMVDVSRGERLGFIGHTDVLIDEETGYVRAFIMPTLKWFGMKKTGDEMYIYWEQIKKIGDDLMIIDTREEE